MMMRTILGALAITTLASHSASAAPTQETVLAPLSDWKVEAGNNACKLQRSFGTEGDSLLLQVASYGWGVSVEFLLSGRQASTLMPNDTIHIDYGVGKPIKAGFSIIPKADDGTNTIVFTGSVTPSEMDYKSTKPRIDMEMLDQARQITFIRGKRKLVLQSGDMRPAFKALAKCNDALVTEWGFDAAEQANLTRHPEPKDGLALAQRLNAQYPKDKVNTDTDAHVNIVLFVDETGKPTRCIVPQSYNPPVFDAIACRTTMAAPFQPALDKEGKPIASYLTSTIYFFAQRP
jgi:hypothetical protein